MIQGSLIRSRIVLSSAVIVLMMVFCTSTFLAVGQSSGASSSAAQSQSKTEGISGKSAHARLADVSGSWQVSWETRLGTNKGILHLQQDGTKLTGTFKDLHGISSLSGTVDESQITFDVQFQGPQPFTIRFKGRADVDDIRGTSQAVNVEGGSGAFLGHGGEVVHPEHPWTAKRETDGPVPPVPTGANASSAAKI